MMDAAARTEAWRHAKRKAGYRQVVLWLPAALKAEFDALAYTRGQDLATCLADALHTLATQGPRKPLRLDGRQLQDLKDELAADILRRLGAPETARAEASAALPVDAPTGARAGGKPGVALETLRAIVAERKQYPTFSLNKLAEHLHTTGVYSTTSRLGERIQAQGATVKQLLDKAARHGLS